MKQFPKDLLQYISVNEEEINNMSWKKKIPVRCSVCGDWSDRTISSVVRAYNEGRECKCKKCARAYAASKISKETRSRVNIERHLLNRLERFDNYYQEMGLSEQVEKAKRGELTFKDQILWKCDKGHQYWQTACNHISNGEGCPMCVSHEYGSKYEDELEEIIKSINPDIKIERNVHGYLGGAYEMDLYIPSYRIGIEFNGSYWHASKGYQLKTPKNIHYHRDKFILAEERGIHLISIWDVDWYNRKDKVVSYIRHLLSDKRVIYARNCEVRKISKIEAMEFCDLYHMQSRYNKAEINYGLFYDSKLVSVMCFGYDRFTNTEGKYELFRYCVKDGVTVVGGAEKLHKEFERNNNWKIIISYSDNDYFTGDIYPRLEYEYKGITRERYFWTIDGREEVRREQAQLKRLSKKYPELYKQSLQIDGNKEDYIMLSLKYRKCYRSGNKRWIKQYKDQ